jgi:glycerate 2-kinase
MILVCPTAFKGTVSARDAAEAMAAGARDAAGGVEVRALPLSDGGNGLLDSLGAARGGSWRTATVAGPTGVAVDARYLVQGGDAVVETAEACGLHLVPGKDRDPLHTTTRGVGELLLAAAGADGAACGARIAADRLVVGLGGSATVDAGSGMASALGWRLLDEPGSPIPPGGRGLLRLHAIEPPATPPPVPPVLVLADVTNPLVGPEGAARVFGPQKGADLAAVQLLEQGLARWSDIVLRDLGRRVAELPGGGAAGGLGAAFAAYLGSPPARGAEWVLEAVGFDDLLASARLVVTGEGSWDAQSAMGKVTGEVVARAGAAGVPVLLVVGSLRGDVPRGVHAETGDGSVLGTDGMAALVRSRAAALLRAGTGQ